MADAARKRPRLDAAAASAADRPPPTQEPQTQPLAVDASRWAASAFPAFQQPRAVGRFSLDGRRHFTHDSSQRRYLCPGLDDWGVGGDLNEGYDAGRYEPREEGLHEGLENLARWIMAAEQLPRCIGPSPSASVGPHKATSAGFVTWRGHLSKLALTPYQREPWRIAAQRLSSAGVHPAPPSTHNVSH